MGYMDNFKTSLNQVFRLSPNEEIEDEEMLDDQTEPLRDADVTEDISIDKDDQKHKYLSRGQADMRTSHLHLTATVIPSYRQIPGSSERSFQTATCSSAAM